MAKEISNIFKKNYGIVTGIEKKDFPEIVSKLFQKYDLIYYGKEKTVHYSLREKPLDENSQMEKSMDNFKSPSYILRNAEKKAGSEIHKLIRGEK